MYWPWFVGKDFSTDWTTTHFSTWRRILAPWRDAPVRVLEIGSWEGRSAVFFLRYLRRSTIVCVDTFAGASEYDRREELAAQVAKIEARFDANLRPFGARIEKIKSESVPALARLAAQGRRFDLAYIDGSHRPEDVMADSIQTWPLIEPGGAVIWDDYGPAESYRLAEEHPRPAIDAFLAERPGAFRPLAQFGQMIVARV